MGNLVQDQLKANGIDIKDLDLGDLKKEVNKTLRQTGDPDAKYAGSEPCHFTNSGLPSHFVIKAKGASRAIALG